MRMRQATLHLRALSYGALGGLIRACSGLEMHNYLGCKAAERWPPPGDRFSCGIHVAIIWNSPALLPVFRVFLLDIQTDMHPTSNSYYS